MFYSFDKSTQPTNLASLNSSNAKHTKIAQQTEPSRQLQSFIVQQTEVSNRRNNPSSLRAHTA